MPEVNERDAKLIELLNEAYGKERQLENALENHLSVTTRDDYEKQLRRHLKALVSHAIPTLTVLSYHEILPSVRIEPVGLAALV